MYKNVENVDRKVLLNMLSITITGYGNCRLRQTEPRHNVSTNNTTITEPAFPAVKHYTRPPCLVQNVKNA
jgi:hypothetical protein